MTMKMSKKDYVHQKFTPIMEYAIYLIEAVYEAREEFHINVKLLLKQAKDGDLSAQYDLGSAYYFGRGLRQDYTEAVKWFQSAAGQGNADAQLALCICYGLGNGVRKNKTQAVKWLKLAAEQGLADAQSILGVLYRDGQGVQQDDAEAIKWLNRAVKQGLAEAQLELGIIHAFSTPPNRKQAILLFKRAARQGNAPAVHCLNSLYDIGPGVMCGPVSFP